ncbi:GNAT family N-acetyltransferase [Thermomonas hydrothermalis]|uniref:Ribosomal protein S18 acetylase RimI n=1 Tax=Thermomonas hydrothermalis TaxID=213588 RepID=A0A1M4WDR7_9GAMM|nr:GNAT family N-acetyltransferase [Thermomonas hydrothermalis]SHE79122.1 Ribosomal protein S18 acetylase RimI [Thermomonas hydrothermalis]
MTVTIRPAVPDDAATLATLGAATFVEAFGHLYRPEDLQAFLQENHTPAAYAKALADPRYALWLAEDVAGQAIGYAQAGPCGLPHPDVQPEDGELKRLYVRAGYQSGGVGRALMDAAMAWLLRDGPRTLWVSVWSENFGAQRFYARYGFAFAGEYAFIVGQQRDREFMYRREPVPT